MNRNEDKKHAPVRLGRRNTGAIGLMALSVLIGYLLLGQRTFYREDGYQLVYQHLSKGSLQHDIHPLYLPAVSLFETLFSFTGFGLHRLAVFFSGFSTAIAIYLVGRLALLCSFSQRQALLLMGLVATTPAVAFFATVVEFHAFFFLFASLAILCAERVVQEAREQRGWRPSLRVLLLSLVTSLACLAHSSGQLLIPLLLAWIGLRAGFRAKARSAFLFVLLHIAGYLSTAWLLTQALGIESHAGTRSLDWIAGWLDLSQAVGRILPVLKHEFLLAYFPLCFVIIGALFAKTTRKGLLVCSAVFFCYFLAVLLILADRSTGAAILERGAYLLPLAIPMAFLLLHWKLPRLGCLAAVLLSSTMSVSVILSHDQRPGREFAQSFRTVSEGKAARVLAVLDESTWILLELPEVDHLLPDSFLVEPKIGKTFLPFFDAWVDNALAEKRRFFLTTKTRNFLAATDSGKLLLKHVSARYRLVPHSSAGLFSGEELISK